MTRRRDLQGHSQAPLSNEPTHASSTKAMPLPIRTATLLGTPSKILRSGTPEFVRGPRQSCVTVGSGSYAKAYILSTPQKLLQSETQAKHTPSIFFLRDTSFKCYRQRRDHPLPDEHTPCSGMSHPSLLLDEPILYLYDTSYRERAESTSSRDATRSRASHTSAHE